MDHGDACLALATILGAAGDAAGQRAAAERAIDLYERKGAGALAERARRILGEPELRPAPAPPEVQSVELDNACVQAGSRLIDAVNREDWDGVAQLLAPHVSVESRRKIVGFPRTDIPSSQWPQDMRQFLETGMVRYRHVAVAVRGERLALTRLVIGTADLSSGAPQDEMLHVAGLDEEGRIALQVWFDVDDLDAAIAELDAAHRRLEELHPRAPLENAASRADNRFNALFASRRWDDIGALFADDIRVEDRRRGLRREGNDRATELAELRAIADLGTKTMTSHVLAIRGERLALVRTLYSGRDQRPEAFHTEVFRIAEIDADERIVAYVAFDPNEFEAAIAELDARYIAGDAAAYAHTWSLIARAFAAINRHELPELTPDWVNIDHRRGAAFATGDMTAYLKDLLDHTPDINVYIEVVHRLSNLGTVVTQAAHGTSQQGFQAEWREIGIFTFDGDLLGRYELFDDADVATAIAKFKQLSRPAPQLQNAASQVAERFLASFAARDWNAMVELLADDMSSDDRRAVIGAGIRLGPDAVTVEMRANADLWITKGTFAIVATRGERLALMHARFSGSDQEPQAFLTEVLAIGEINANERIVAIVTFDLDDFDAALAELDARYIAGEGAAHARTWSAIARAYASISGRELAATTPDWVNIDHRRAAAFAPGEANAYIRAAWDLTKNLNIYAEAVYRLNDLGAVVAHAARGTSLEGFDAEWRAVNLFAVEGEKISRTELFDEADIDAVIARFDQLRSPAPRLENAGSQVYERFLASFAARDWDAMGETLADDAFHDDRRRVVGGGLGLGRAAVIAEMSALAGIGVKRIASEIIATRGGRLILSRSHAAGHDERPEAFRTDVLSLAEIHGNERIVALVTFDPDDFDAAIAELDARYLAGEAAAHARTWSAIARVYATLNRGELPSTTTDFEDYDHRRGPTTAPGDLMEYLRAALDQTPDVNIYVEAVHRLSGHGAVVTHVADGTTREGFNAEWRVISLVTAEGDTVNRCELFDEADIDAALTKFDQLNRPATRLENAASQAEERYLTHFMDRNWDAVAEALTDDFYIDDRRRVVNAGIRHGRDAEIEDLRAAADVGFTLSMPGVIATRGERLAVTHVQGSGRDAETIQADALQVFEIDADELIAAVVVFDLDDIDAAIEELDARYLAGEAAAHSHTWSVIMGTAAAFKRRELPATTPDWVNVDHRRATAFAPGDFLAYLRAAWDQLPDISFRIEAVHRLSSLGAVVTHYLHGTSQEGFEAEWREIHLMTIEGDLYNRSEVFDEADIDAALARFDELHSQTRLGNAASQVAERFLTHFAASDWHAVAEMLADNFSNDDRRRVVGAGVRHGRDAQIADMRAIADLWITTFTATSMAIRGKHLVLMRAGISFRDQGPESFVTEVLGIVEINGDEQIVALVSFDPDDFDAAFAELDARYLAGEAASHAHTWSVISECFATLSRHELPSTTTDLVDIDHRRGAAFAPGELLRYVHAGWEINQSTRTYAEVVHRLNDLGAVVTHAADLISRDGFEAEWRTIDIFTIEGDLINRCEIFDESDLDAALARFDELHPQTPRLENTASQVAERFQTHFVASDWDAIAETLADNFCGDDRRRVVGAGVRHGREAQTVAMRATADLWIAKVTSTVIATRGKRLALIRGRFWNRDQSTEAFLSEVLAIVEINTEERIVAIVSFDPDDIDAAFAELDARYLAGEAAAHARMWSVIADAFAAINRHEIPAATKDYVIVDHQLQHTAVEASGLTEYLNASWDLTPDLRMHIEAVHQLSDLGAVITLALHGTSQEGFEAEWRIVELLTGEGDVGKRCEIFAEADLPAALARFEELHPQARRLENAATRATERSRAALAARDWDAMTSLLAEGFSSEDRRRVVNTGMRRGRDVGVKDLQAAVDVIGIVYLTSVVIATRGERLELISARVGNDERPEAVQFDILQVTEIDADERIAAVVTLDGDDLDAAVAELDARYLAGEAASHAQTWSVVAAANRAVNRREAPATTSDWTMIDHRPIATFEADDLPAFLDATWTLTSDINLYIEAVHRLSDLGAVVTHASHGTSREGLDVEWHDDQSCDSRRGSASQLRDLRPGRHRRRRCPLRRAASARVPAGKRGKPSARAFHGALRGPGLECDRRNSARRPYLDDRRRVVNAGIRHGRDAEIANMQTAAGVGTRTSCRSSLQPAERASLSVVPASRGATRDLMRFTPRCSTSLRSTPTNESQRSSCSTSTTSMPPSRSLMLDTLPAKRPSTRARGRSSDANTPRSTGTNSPQRSRYVDHRRGTPFEVQQPDRGHPRHLGPHARPHHPHRGGASAQQFRGGRNSYGERDLPRRFLRRVANDRTLECRGRPSRALRAIRRGRHRRSPCPL